MKRITLSFAERLARYSIMLLSAIAAVQYYLKADWVSLASACLTIGLLLLPPVISKLLRLVLPTSVRVVYLLFIFAAMYLGELHSFFYVFHWWDSFLHTFSAMMLAYVFYILIFVLNRDRDIGSALSPAFIAFFVFAAPMAFGAVWELLEYGADVLFDVNMLKGRDPSDITRFYDYRRALLNTFHDLMLDAGGALLIAISALLHHRGAKSFRAFGSLKDSFLTANPRFTNLQK